MIANRVLAQNQIIPNIEAENYYEASPLYIKQGETGGTLRLKVRVYHVRLDSSSDLRKMEVSLLQQGFPFSDLLCGA